VFLWPADRPDLRARVGLAVGLLLASKARSESPAWAVLLKALTFPRLQVATVHVPYLFKLAVDGLGAEATAVPIWGVVAATPAALLVGYGLARGGAALCNGACCSHWDACAYM